MSTIAPDNTLLGLLAIRPRHGYELLEILRDPKQLGQVWKLSTSQLYAVLKRLETHGLTIGREVPAVDAPARTEYALTPRGRLKLDAWLNDPRPSASVRRIRVEFLSRLYIAARLGCPADPIIERQTEACSHKLAELVAQRASGAQGIGLLALDLVIAQLGVILEWLARVRDALRQHLEIT